MSRLISALKLAGQAGRFLAMHPSQWSTVRRMLVDRRRSSIELRQPWWPYAAIDAVRSALPPEARVLEYGGGGSTLWLEDLGAQVVTVEHDREWAETLSRLVGRRVSIKLREPDADGSFGSYLKAAAETDDESVDLVIIDGRERVASGMACISKLRPGGMLLLDDSDRERYQALRRELAHWEYTDYRGLKSTGAVAQTTVWCKPVQRPAVP